MVGKKVKALAGLKVLELGDFISASYCTKLMADLGAEVIKIERPKVGDEARRHRPFKDNVPHPEGSGLFCYLNNNKRGITLDIESVKGKEILEDLLAASDVFVHNYPPPIMKKLDLQYERLRSINSMLIMTSITPYGQTGCYHNYKGYAINAAALGGISYVTGEPEREPITPPLSLGHYQSGVAGAVGTMFAVLARESLRRGQHVDISEADFWITNYTGHLAHAYVFDGRKKMRTGHRTPGLYPFTILPCKDGFVNLIAIRGYQWKKFIELVGNGETPEWYVRDPRWKDRRSFSKENADEMDEILASWLMAHTKEEIFSLCQKNHIPFAPVRDFGEVTEDPHLAERGFFVDINRAEVGTLKYPGAPYKYSKTPWKIDSPSPLLGEHNEYVYCNGLGYSKKVLKQLKSDGVI